MKPQCLSPLLLQNLFSEITAEHMSKIDAVLSSEEGQKILEQSIEPFPSSPSDFSQLSQDDFTPSSATGMVGISIFVTFSHALICYCYGWNLEFRFSSLFRMSSSATVMVGIWNYNFRHFFRMPSSATVIVGIWNSDFRQFFCHIAFQS